MSTSKKLLSLLLCLTLVVSGFSFAFAGTNEDADSYMKEVVETLGANLDGEDMMDYLSYVYLGWRTTGGPWQNQVIDDFARGELVEAGYTNAGIGSIDQYHKSANDKSSDHSDDFVWTTYFDDISSLTWSPEYAKLELTTEAEFEGVDELIDRVNVESYAFDPTCDTYQEYYGDLYDLPESTTDSEWIDGMWDWITTKDADGNRVYVNKEDPQAGLESQLQKRVHLTWNSCFTDPRGTDPAEAVGTTGEVVYIGTTNGTTWSNTEVTDLAGKVILTDSSLRNAFNLAQKTDAIAVASKASLSNYSQPKDPVTGEWIDPYYDSARYASGASLTVTKAQTETGKPIVEWQFSNNQYDALKELLEKADKPVYAKNVAIGTAYEMNDEAYGGMGQAITVAEVKGSTYPDERVFLCAHVQEPGSNDNATGVATLLGMATEYKRMIDAGEIERPERTITFMWGDEMSMATLYMSSHAEEKENLVTVLDLDMTGEDPEMTGGVMRIEKTPDPSAKYNYTLDILPWEDDAYLDETFADPYGDFTRLPDSHTLWGAGSFDGMFQEGFYLNDLYMYATQNVIKYHDDEFQVDVCPYEGGSDHSRFLAQGVPAMLTWHFTDYTYHTSVDTLALSSGREMENVGITSLAAAIFNADIVD
ncbi:MAG: M28 family peptidase, partial [Firmicutes bacterium]|nr:M28 family peptidase [Bacillota bacterium]